jgi:hypothetical protein
LIQEEKTSLSNLLEDIKNRRGDKEKYQEYINFEKRKINMLTDLYSQYLIDKKKFIPRYYQAYRELDLALTKWENENMNKK